MRITVDGVPKEVSTGRECDPTKWMSKANRAKGTKEDIKTLNAYLDIHLQMTKSREDITVESIKMKYLGDIRRKTLLAVFLEHNEQMKALVGEKALRQILIAKKNNGKPFGIYVFDDDNTVLSPVSFESFHANEVSNSSLGLMPTILAHESLKNDFGDLGETCLKTAISYIFGKGAEFSQYKHTSAGRELYHRKDIFGILKNNNRLILQR